MIYKKSLYKTEAYDLYVGEEIDANFKLQEVVNESKRFKYKSYDG